MKTILIEDGKLYCPKSERRQSVERCDRCLYYRGPACLIDKDGNEGPEMAMCDFKKPIHSTTWPDIELPDPLPSPLGALDELEMAARFRENIMGDPGRYMQAVAEVNTACRIARAVIHKEKER